MCKGKAEPSHCATPWKVVIAFNWESDSESHSASPDSRKMMSKFVLIGAILTTAEARNSLARTPPMGCVLRAYLRAPTRRRRRLTRARFPFRTQVDELGDLPLQPRDADGRLH